MTVKQISVFVENKPGCLAEVAEVLSKNNIDMRAMSIAESTDFGVLRLIVNDAFNTTCVLKEAGYICSMTDVIAVEIPDKPGSLLETYSVLSKNNINMEYSYAFTTSKKDCAHMVLRTSDTNAAIKVLKDNGIVMLQQEDLEK